MPEHRPSHHRDAPRADIGRVRRRRRQRTDHGRLRRSFGRLIAWNSGALILSASSSELKRSRPGSAGGVSVGRLLLEGRAFFALIAIIVVFSFLSPNYFTLGNFLTMATHVAIFGILAVGMLLVVLNGGIDLSVGSTLGLSGVVAGFLMQGLTLQMFGIVLFPPV